MSRPSLPALLLVLLVGVFAARPAHAQTTHASATWEAVFFTADFDVGKGEGVGPALWLDVHLRQRPDIGDKPGSFQGILRPGFGWSFVPGVSLWGGYAWIPAVASGGGLKSEHEAWVQMVLAHTFDRVNLQFRPRFEVRRLDGQDETGLRVRTFARMAVTLRGPFQLLVWDEAFFEANTTAWEPAGVDENRVFLGAAFQATPWLRAELGYMNRFVPAATHGPTDVDEHIALMVLSFRARVERRHAPPPADAGA